MLLGSPPDMVQKFLIAQDPSTRMLEYIFPLILFDHDKPVLVFIVLNTIHKIGCVFDYYTTLA